MTLDANVCAEAYRALDGRKGAIGVYNYETGEIICMVSSPTYDPQNPPSISADDKSGVYINRFTSSKFPPGSIFKLVTAAASIETLDDAYSFQVQCSGKEDYGNGDKVPDLANQRTVARNKALDVSCNAYSAKLS